MAELQFYDRKFTLLLIDAITLATYATKVRGESRLESTYARGCILYAGILLECCSNHLLENVPGQTLRKDLDKLPFLSKFDIYIRSVADTPLDRGRNEVQLVEELKRLRDAFVHPKTKKIEGKKAEKPSSNSAHEYNIPLKKLQAIDISMSPGSWRADDAIKALRAAEVFLRYVFVELIQMSPTDAFRFLVSGIEIGGGEAQFVESDLAEVLEDASQLGLDFSFIFPADALAALKESYD